MSTWHSYPKIYNVGHKYLEDLFKGPVIIQEKVDGSQFSFSKVGDRLFFRSRGMEQDSEKPDGMFKLIVEHVKTIRDQLTDGWTYRGEYLSKPGHNTLIYNRIPKNYFAMFDVEIAEQSYLDYDAMRLEAERLGFEAVPLLASPAGETCNIHNLQSLLERESFLGGPKIEGIVIKNYAYFGPDKKALMGKIVSEDFKEAHGNEWTMKNPCPTDFMELVGQKYCTTARWQKAVQHLAERNELTQSAQDIGKLIPEVKEDVLKECGEEIKQMLIDHAWKKISSKLVAGLPQWYKEQLLKKQFEAPPC